MSLTTSIQITDQDVRSTTSTQGGEALGQLAGTADGRVFAYGYNGTGSGTALSPGKLTQGALSVSNAQNSTGVATVAGQNSVSYTTGSTAVTADQYKDGYFIVNAGAGAGQVLRIAGNTAATSTNSYAITVYLVDAIETATTTSSKFSLQPNPFGGVKITDHTASTAVFAAGVPQVSVADTYYAWLQVGGVASVLANGTIAVGSSVIISATTDGAVDIDGSTNINPKVGYTLLASVSTEYRAVYLTVNNA